MGDVLAPAAFLEEAEGHPRRGMPWPRGERSEVQLRRAVEVPPVAFRDDAQGLEEEGVAIVMGEPLPKEPLGTGHVAAALRVLGERKPRPAIARVHLHTPPEERPALLAAALLHGKPRARCEDVQVDPQRPRRRRIIVRAEPRVVGV